MFLLWHIYGYAKLCWLSFMRNCYCSLIDNWKLLQGLYQILPHCLYTKQFVLSFLFYLPLLIFPKNILIQLYMWWFGQWMPQALVWSIQFYLPLSDSCFMLWSFKDKNSCWTGLQRATRCIFFGLSARSGQEHHPYFWDNPIRCITHLETNIINYEQNRILIVCYSDICF